MFSFFRKKKNIAAIDSHSEFDFLSWEHRKPSQLATISYIQDFSGGSDLRLACTQLALPPKQRKLLLDEWVNFLTTQQGLRQVFLYSKVPQSLIAAISQIGQLDSLFIKWSGDAITDYSPINKLSKLRRLYIGSGTTLENLHPLNELQNLAWLEIHEQSSLNSFEGIEKLRKLKGLIVTGGLQGKMQLRDLEPLRELNNLRYLSLASTQAASGSLAPLCDLKKLRYLNLPIYYEMAEFAKVFACLPDCDHGIAAYRETGQKCGTCTTGQVVYPMSKGKRKLCTHCNSDKLEQLRIDFLNLVKAEKSAG